MKTKIRFSIILLVLAFRIGTAGAQTSTGMGFLLMGPTAHNMGVSDGHTASLSGAGSIYLNPAMMAYEKSSSATLSYMVWPATDTQNSFAGMVAHRGSNTLGFAILSSLIDDIPFRNRPSTDPDGLFAVRYLSLAASYARSFGPLSAGLTGMYLYEQFFQSDASGYAFTAGLGTQLFNERVRLGASLRNAGSMAVLNETATELPTLASFGADIQLLQFSTSALDDEIPLLVSIMADYNLPLNEEGSGDSSLLRQDNGYANFGIELSISDLIDLRSGIRTGDTQRRVNFGAGLRAGEFYVNYAYVPFETGFGTSHAISVQYLF